MQTSPEAADLWWKRHRPLILVTEAIGPMKSQRNPEPQPDLRACRHFTVVNDLILSVHCVTREEMTLAASQGSRPDRPHGLDAGIGGAPLPHS